VERDILLTSQNGSLRNWWALLDLAYGTWVLVPLMFAKLI